MFERRSVLWSRTGSHILTCTWLIDCLCFDINLVHVIWYCMCLVDMSCLGLSCLVFHCEILQAMISENMSHPFKKQKKAAVAALLFYLSSELCLCSATLHLLVFLHV